MNTFDERDAVILQKRINLLNQVSGPRVGDFVRFACGTERRISHIWTFEDRPDEIQTSQDGSYYLGDGFVSMSGSLYTSVSSKTLTLTQELKAGLVWFFHHDSWGAGRGVNATMDFRIYRCSEPAPT